MHGASGARRTGGKREEGKGHDGVVMSFGPCVIQCIAVTTAIIMKRCILHRGVSGRSGTSHLIL